MFFLARLLAAVRREDWEGRTWEVGTEVGREAVDSGIRKWIELEKRKWALSSHTGPIHSEAGGGLPVLRLDCVWGTSM